MKVKDLEECFKQGVMQSVYVEAFRAAVEMMMFVAPS
jgi:hypothetical protein